MRRRHAGLAGALVFAASVGAAPVTTHVSGPSPFAGCDAGGPAFVGSEVEPSLAVDPRAPSHMVAAYQQDRNEHAGAKGIVVAATTDGGATWKRSALPVSACAGQAPPASPFASDPWVSIGAGGRIYVASVGREISVATSGDGGSTWNAPVRVAGRSLVDKETITADPAHAGVAYLVWSDYLPTTPPGTESDELLSVTRDGGRTWSAPRTMLRHKPHEGPLSSEILVARRGGRLYNLVSWVSNGIPVAAAPARFLIQRSDDHGATWSRPLQFALGRPQAASRGPVIRATPGIPSFAVDDAGGLYAAWEDARFSRGGIEQVAYAWSGDGGKTWSRPRKVSSADAAGAILPTIAAAASGDVAILYLRLDRRGSPATLRAAYRGLVSHDHGRHFADEAVGPSFDLRRAPHLEGDPLVPGGYFVGDYMGLVALGRGRFGAAFVTASAERDDPTSVLYARLGP